MGHERSGVQPRSHILVPGGLNSLDRLRQASSFSLKLLLIFGVSIMHRERNFSQAEFSWSYLNRCTITGRIFQLLWVGLAKSECRIQAKETQFTVLFSLSLSLHKCYSSYMSDYDWTSYRKHCYMSQYFKVESWLLSLEVLLICSR